MTSRHSFFALLLVACGRNAPHDARLIDSSATTATATAIAPQRVRPGSASHAPCPRTGLWTSCTVLERLDRAGLAPRSDGGRPNMPPFSIAAQRVHLGTTELDLFIYRDVASRERDEKGIDRSRFLEADAPLGMQSLPTLIRSANLIAVLYSRNDHQRERVADALTAGPPQP